MGGRSNAGHLSEAASEAAEPEPLPTPLEPGPNTANAITEVEINRFRLARRQNAGLIMYEIEGANPSRLPLYLDSVNHGRKGARLIAAIPTLETPDWFDAQVRTRSGDYV